MRLHPLAQLVRMYKVGRIDREFQKDSAAIANRMQDARVRLTNFNICFVLWTRRIK